MNRDPHYLAIHDRLAGNLDKNSFELAANALIQRDIPDLVQVPGGTDGGQVISPRKSIIGLELTDEPDEARKGIGSVPFLGNLACTLQGEYGIEDGLVRQT